MFNFWFQAYRKCNRPQLVNIREKPLRRRVEVFVWNKSFIMGLLWTHALIFKNLVLFFFKMHFHTFRFWILKLESWILNLESRISSQIVFNQLGCAIENGLLNIPHNLLSFHNPKGYFHMFSLEMTPLVWKTTWWNHTHSNICLLRKEYLITGHHEHEESLKLPLGCLESFSWPR